MTDDDSIIGLHGDVVNRFAEKLVGAPKGDAPVPHLDWSVSELGAHVLSGIRAYTRAITEGVPMWADPRDGGGGNRALIAATPEREPAEVAEALRPAVTELHHAVRSSTGRPVPAWGDIMVSPVTLVAMHIGDVTVHGWDLDRAIGGGWRITREEAVSTLTAMFEVIPHFVNETAARGLEVTYEIRLRGGRAWEASFDDGNLEITTGRARRAHCRMWNDPVAFLLLAYRRVPLWTVAVTGRAVAYGRRPWLAFRFPSLVATP